MAEISLLQSQLDQINYEIEKSQKYIAQFQVDIARSQAAGDTELANSQRNTLARQQELLAELQAQRAETQQDIEAAKVEQSNTPKDSAGQTVKDDAQAPPAGELKVDDSGRVVKPSETAPTNADKFELKKDVDINATNKTQQQTQSTGQSAGAAAGNEDSSGQTNATRTRINELYNSNNGRITPQPNALASYASYTYSISIYILKPDDITRAESTGRWSVPSSQLLMQSGGISAEQRSQFFPLDYYIDDLVLKSTARGKGSGGAHNVNTLTFKVMEPNGFTFLQNLSNATNKIVSSGKPQNYSAQNFLMVIRFYGYDKDGNPVAIKAINPQLDGTMAPGAPIVKYIPFQFTGIKFRLGANKVVTYDCEAVGIQYNIAAGNARASIVYNVEVVGETVGEVCKEFADKLTEYQKEKVQQGLFDFHDTYEIRIPDTIISGAKVTAPNNESGLESTPMGNRTGARPNDAAKQLAGTGIDVNRRAKKISATAGQSIVQWLDQLIRSSTYITDQQKWLDGVDENGNPTKVPNGSPAQATAWYAINMEATEPKYDPKRNDYVYKIIYIITPYLISYIDSEYFPNGQYRGEHKVYSYWFTGENTEVMDLQLDFNYTYYQAVNAPQAARQTAENYDYREYHKKMYQPTTEASKQNNRDNVNQGGASAAAILYSPADVSLMRMQILGDPAWIQQPNEVSGTNNRASAFADDGSINFSMQDILYKVQFNTPADYNLSTGLLTPTRYQGNM